MDESNPLVLTTVEEEQAHDELLSALTTIARPITQPKSVKTPTSKTANVIRKKRRATETKTPQERRIESELMAEPRRRSRFFFVPTKSFRDQINEARAAIAPVPREPEANAAIEERIVNYLTELPVAMEPNIERVREFFLNEVAPKDLAAQAAMAQSVEIIQKTLNAGISHESHAQFKRMIDRARLYKLAEFVVSYMGLPKTQVAALIQSIEPQKEVLFMGANPADDRRASRPRQVVNPNEQQKD
jgi:hypothetical protein